MYRERMEGLTGRERPWTTMRSFEEALGSGMSARTATEIGFTEMLQDDPDLFATIQSSPNGETMLKQIATDMERAIERVTSVQLPDSLSEEEKKKKQALVLRMEFAKSLLRQQSQGIPEVDFSELDIDMDTLRAEGEAMLAETTAEEQHEDLSFFGEDAVPQEDESVSAAA